MVDSRRYQGRAVLITGAAGGFGRLAAERFAAEGARLSLSDIDAEALATTADALRAGGAEVAARAVDVREEDQIAAQVAEALERFGGLDVAINNAGACHALTPIPDLPLDVFERMMAINARSVFLGMKHQLPPMIAARRGVLLNVASAAGLVGAGMLAAYAASKHAVVGLTRSAADECARYGVRVNALCPSFAATPMYDGIADDVVSARGISREEAADRITARAPMRRVATADEVVQAMLWICSAENSFMTGQAVSIDGGLTAV